MIVGFCGKKQVGKDTVAKIWERLSSMSLNDSKEITTKELLEGVYTNTNSLWPKFAFANKIKDMVALLLSCPVDKLDDPEFKELPLGKDYKIYRYINNFDEIEIFDRKLTETEIYDRGLFPSGVFEHTPRSLMQYLGTDWGRNLIHPNIWINSTIKDIGENNALITDVRFPNECRAIRENNGLLIRVLRDTNLKDIHSSETSIDNWKDYDYVIRNFGTLDELIEQIRKIMLKEGIIHND